jgi:NAD(P)-dependent dehydrogenase (short-subunit alcohol dehydrogenase family)
VAATRSAASPGRHIVATTASVSPYALSTTSKPSSRRIRPTTATGTSAAPALSAPSAASTHSQALGAAKAGVMALTRCAALDVAPHGIGVNAVAPSLAIHPFLAKVNSEALLADLASREAFGRAAEPREVANVIVFLASDYPSYMTGEVISVSSQHP